MDVGMVRQRRLADDIVAQLETMILEGTLKAGERLPAERVLAERFGVSRPSLREAIQKLAAKGLLISRHGGGTFVAESLAPPSATRCCTCWKTTAMPSATCWSSGIPWRAAARTMRRCVQPRWIRSDSRRPSRHCRIAMPVRVR